MGAKCFTRQTILFDRRYRILIEVLSETLTRGCELLVPKKNPHPILLPAYREKGQGHWLMWLSDFDRSAFPESFRRPVGLDCNCWREVQAQPPPARSTARAPASWA